MWIAAYAARCRLFLNIRVMQENIFDEFKRAVQMFVLEWEAKLKKGPRTFQHNAADLLFYRLSQVAKDPRYVVSDLVKQAVEKKIDVIAIPQPEELSKRGRPKRDKSNDIVITDSNKADFVPQINFKYDA